MNENVPELRFPEFREEWEEGKIGDFVYINSGQSPNGILDTNGDIPYFKVEELNNSNKYQIKTPYFVKGTKTIPQGSIIFPKRGAAILLNKIRILNQESFMDTNLMTLTVKNGLNNEFLYYFLLKEKLYKIADTSSIPQINNKHIIPYKIRLPKNLEQNKIASFLSKVDEKIGKLEEKQQLWKTYKKGIMQQIFNQKLRFKDENGEHYPDWEIKNLGNISKIKTGSKDLKDNVNEGKYPFFVRSNTIERINTYSFDGEAILIPGDGVNVGKIYHYINGKFDYHQRVYKISDFSDKSCGKYIYYYMMENFLKQALKNSLKASVDSLRLPTIKEMKVNLPSLPEQTKIANFLSNIDEKIEEVNRELELHKEFKKGLLQKMFC